MGWKKVVIVWPPAWFKVLSWNIPSLHGWPFSKGILMTQGHKPHWFPAAKHCWRSSVKILLLLPKVGSGNWVPSRNNILRDIFHATCHSMSTWNTACMMKSNAKTQLVCEQLPCLKKQMKLSSKNCWLHFELCYWSKDIFEERKMKKIKA